MADQSDTRQQGIEFGEFGETMDTLDYPIDHADLIAEHGDTELEYSDGTTTLEGILEPLQDEDQTYEDREELETMIKNMVGSDAVGREGYSDRGTSSDPEGDEDQESL